VSDFHKFMTATFFVLASNLFVVEIALCFCRYMMFLSVIVTWIAGASGGGRSSFG
jgi:hypothetical protein